MLDLADDHHHRRGSHKARTLGRSVSAGRETLRPLARRTRLHRAQLHIDAEDANRIVFVELWADLAAVQVHFAMPESGAFVRQLGVMAVGRPEIRLFEADEIAR